MLLLEQNDEWLVSRRYFSESSLALLMTRDRPDHPTAPQDRELPQLTAS